MNKYKQISEKEMRGKTIYGFEYLKDSRYDDMHYFKIFFSDKTYILINSSYWVYTEK